MPTPFMHLHTAEQIRSTIAAQNGDGRLLAQLDACWPAFYLGSVAPDINAICEITRFATHFYRTPPPPGEQAYDVMLAQYPELACGPDLAANRAVFVAAYRAHLLLDLVWLRQIVDPFFFHADHLGDRKQRQLTHFILLTWLDGLALAALPDTAVTTLSHAVPQQWLPFAPDETLVSWRDIIVDQLQPEALPRTVEIYANRIGVSPETFAANLQDDAWMAEHVFGKIPVDQVQAHLTTAVTRSVELIRKYLYPT
ncbi:MAG TPA: hypothetical protein ENJ93_03070 [Chloroflexi bacterium]|nr:hypothetical protein [Chloroflexota bacterium]